MSRLSWRDEERLRDKIARLEDQLDEAESLTKAVMDDRDEMERKLDAALSEIKRLRP